MADARVVVAFTAGMLATVNPCALPMLPAYLGWFITGDEEDAPPRARVARAVVVALGVTLGFMVVFGVLGAVTAAASTQVEAITPWLTPVIGVALAAMGVVLLTGRSIRLPLPQVTRGTRGRGLAAIVLYGASYAIVSVSCTLGIFLFQVSLTFGQSWATGLTQLAGFASGFALVLVALSVSVALARGSLAAGARRASAHVGRIAGGLLVLTGLYLVWYGYHEIQLADRGHLRPDHRPGHRLVGGHLLGGAVGRRGGGRPGAGPGDRGGRPGRGAALGALVPLPVRPDPVRASGG